MNRLTGDHYEMVIEERGGGTYRGFVIELGGYGYGATPEWVLDTADWTEVITETTAALVRYEQWAA